MRGAVSLLLRRPPAAGSRRFRVSWPRASSSSRPGHRPEPLKRRIGPYAGNPSESKTLPPETSARPADARLIAWASRSSAAKGPTNASERAEAPESGPGRRSATGTRRDATRPSLTVLCVDPTDEVLALQDPVKHLRVKPNPDDLDDAASGNPAAGRLSGPGGCRSEPHVSAAAAADTTARGDAAVSPTSLPACNQRRSVSSH